LELIDEPFQIQVFSSISNLLVGKEETEAYMRVILRFLVDLIRESRDKHPGEGNAVSAPEQGSEPCDADEQRAASKSTV